MRFARLFEPLFQFIMISKVLNIVCFGRWYHNCARASPLDDAVQNEVKILQNFAKQLAGPITERYTSRYDAIILPSYRSICTAVINLFEATKAKRRDFVCLEEHALDVQATLCISLQVLSPPVRNKPWWYLRLRDDGLSSMFTFNQPE